MNDIKLSTTPGRSPSRRTLKRTKSFVDAVREKYCIELDERSVGNGFRDGFVIKYIQRKSKDNGNPAELGFLRNVGLNNFRISHAGLPPEGLASLCPNVIDLDLSNNNIACWSEILTILTELPNLKFVNLSKNKLLNTQNCIQKWKKPLKNVESIVLNDTEIAWPDVNTLASNMPKLNELHVCRNFYLEIDNEDCSGINGLECLYLNENAIESWDEVWKLRMLPKLKTLIVSGNPLQDVYYNNQTGECVCSSDGSDFLDGPNMEDLVFEVDDLEENEPKVPTFGIETHNGNTVNNEGADPDKETGIEDLCAMNDVSTCMQCTGTPFPELTTLCISDTDIYDWDHLEELTKFPQLCAVRMKDTKLFSELSEEDRRKLLVACLPTVKTLNGSAVSDTDREKAERHLLRYFSDYENKPQIYNALREKHGQLSPLANIDIGYGFQEWAHLKFVHKGCVVHEDSIHIIEPVCKLRIYVSKTLKLPIRSFRMWHHACGASHREDPLADAIEELFLDSLPMSRFDFLDNDEILIEDIDTAS